MSKKIQKSMVVAGAVTLSGVLSQTANADQLDDAINEAKKAGFEIVRTTKLVNLLKSITKNELQRQRLITQN